MAPQHSGEYTCTISSALGVTRWSTRVKVRRLDPSFSELTTGGVSMRALEETVGAMVPSRPDVWLLQDVDGVPAVALRWNISLRVDGKIVVMEADQESLYSSQPGRELELYGFLVEYFSPDWAADVEPTRGVGGQVGWRRVPHVLEYVDGGWPVRGCLEPGLQYYFVVRGRNRAGYGPPSPVAGPISIPPVEPPAGPLNPPANPSHERDSQRPPAPQSSSAPASGDGVARAAVGPFSSPAPRPKKSTTPTRAASSSPASGAAGGEGASASSSAAHWVFPALMGLVAAIVFLCFMFTCFLVFRARLCAHKAAFSKSRESRMPPHYHHYGRCCFCRITV